MPGQKGHSRGANDALIFASRYNSASGSRTPSDDLDLVIAEENLAVVAIAPRFDMPGMVDALFSPEQVD
jgi:hypothetical protein